MSRVPEIVVHASMTAPAKPARSEKHDDGGFSSLIDSSVPAPPADVQADGADRSAKPAAPPEQGPNPPPKGQRPVSNVLAELTAVSGDTVSNPASPDAAAVRATSGVVAAPVTAQATLAAVVTDKPAKDAVKDSDATDTIADAAATSADPSSASQIAGGSATGPTTPAPVAVVLSVVVPADPAPATTSTDNVAVTSAVRQPVKAPASGADASGEIVANNSGAQPAPATADASKTDVSANKDTASATAVAPDFAALVDGSQKADVSQNAVATSAPATAAIVAQASGKPAVASTEDVLLATAKPVEVTPQPQTQPQGSGSPLASSDANPASAKTAVKAHGSSEAAPAASEAPSNARGERDAADPANALSDIRPTPSAPAVASSALHQGASSPDGLLQSPLSIQTVTPVQAQLTAIVLPQGAPVPIEGLAVEIAARARSGKSRFEIRLDPPELGRIDVRLDIDSQGKVSSHVIVEKSETLDLLRRDAPQLQQALNDSGLKTGDSGMQFSLRDQSFSGGNKQNDDGRQSARLVITDDDTVPPVIAGRSYRPLIAPGGVDIRV